MGGSAASQDLIHTDVAALPNGGLVAVWQEFHGRNHRIYGAVFDADGTRCLNDFVVVSTSGLPFCRLSHFQIQPVPDGSSVIFHIGRAERCMIQHFAGLGVAMRDAIRVDGPGAVADDGQSTIAPLETGDLVVS